MGKINFDCMNMEEECKKMTSTANHDWEANEFALS
jgi:hypothetical protein